MFSGIDSAAVVYFLFLDVYGGSIGGFLLEGLMGWDVRRAERDFIGWRFGVGGVMMFVVVFVVVFATEWKRGEWRMKKEEREGKGRGEKRIGEGRKESRRGEERRGGQTRGEKRRGEKRRKETSRICEKECVRETGKKPEKRISPHTIKPLHMSENVRHPVPFRIDKVLWHTNISLLQHQQLQHQHLAFFPFPLPTDELFIHPFS